MITGVLYGEKIFFGSVYAPNIFDNSFYSKLLADVTSVCRPNVVLDGDFNWSVDKTNACSITTCVLSDHSPVSIELSPPYYDPLSRHCRLNPSLLSHPTFLTYLESQWELFMSTNNLPEVSASTLWETGKAFPRGSIISYTAAKRKSTLAKQLDLERDIVTLERDFRESSYSLDWPSVGQSCTQYLHLETKEWRNILKPKLLVKS